jgi:hypothetical protein
MSIPNTTYRVLVEKIGGQNPSQFVGNEGEVFYDPDSPSPVLKLSDGTTPGGVSIGGTGGGNTGNITFSGERIIGDINDEFALGAIQLTPSLDNPDSGQLFVTNGQYVNIYPTVADDAPHIHITAGTLSTTSNYYDPLNNYYKGDIFLGDDSNYFSVLGNGDVRIQSSSNNGEMSFGTGLYDRYSISFYCDGNGINLYNQGLDFDNDYSLASGRTDYIGVASSSIIYTSKVYDNEVGSMKLLVQCQGTNNNCQLSELLIVRPYNGTSVFINEIGRVTGIGLTAHITFTAAWNGSSSEIEVYADTSSDPDNDQWSFRVMPIELHQYQD